MIVPDVPEWKARQALEGLCQISESPRVGMKARWEVIRLIITTLIERKMHKDALTRLIKHVESQVPNLAPQFQERLQELLKDSDPTLLACFFPALAVPATPTPSQEVSPAQADVSAQASPQDSLLVVAPDTGAKAAPSSVSLPPVEPPVQTNVFDRLAGWLEALHGQAALLLEVKGRILELERENGEVKAQLATATTSELTARGSAAEAIAAQKKAENRLLVLEEELWQTQKAREAALATVRELESELDAVRSRESQAISQLRQQGEDFAREREDLQRLIEANADRRLQEFCNAVGGSLRRLLNRIPDRSSPVSPELGGVLLARLHEVIDELEAKGVRARPDPEAFFK